MQSLRGLTFHFQNLFRAPDALVGSVRLLTAHVVTPAGVANLLAFPEQPRVALLPPQMSEGERGEAKRWYRHDTKKRPHQRGEGR